MAPNNVYEMISFIRDFNLSDIKYGEVKVLDSGMKSIPMFCNDAPIIIQTPQCYAPYGINCYSNESSDSFVVDLSFRDKETRKSLKMLYDKFTELDQKNIQQGFNQSQQYFKKKHNSLEIVEALYSPIIKHPKDKTTGEITDMYPPTLKIKIPSKLGKLNCELFDEKENKIEDYREIQTKGAKMIAIIQCSGLWIAGGKIGCSWKLIQMQIFSSPKISNFAIKYDEDDNLESSDDDDE